MLAIPALKMGRADDRMNGNSTKDGIQCYIALRVD